MLRLLADLLDRAEDPIERGFLGMLMQAAVMDWNPEFDLAALVTLAETHNADGHFDADLRALHEAIGERPLP